jgi:large repetitive protein
MAADVSGPHTITELAGKTGDTADLDTTSGTLTFTDVDLSDTHTVGNSLVSATWSGSATLPSGLSTVLATALATSVSTDSTGSGSGSIAFTFSATDNSFDFLATGQTLTVIYNVTVTDNTGASSTQPVTITIVGTNDAAVIGDPTVHDLTEDVNVNANGNLTASGTISITDADQNQGSFQTTVTGAQGNLGSLTLQANGSYTYTVADSAVQFLGANDTKVDTFTVTAFDGTTKQISFTIHGTNDAAVIGDPTVHDVTEDVNVNANGNLTASGTISITDADQNQASFQTTVTGAQGNLGSLTLQANGSYTYTVADSAVQFLGANDTKVDTFTVTAFDGTTKQISFTIHGTNDALVAVDDTGSATEAGGTNNGIAGTNATGNVLANDIDVPNASLAVTGSQAAPGAHGTLTLNVNGSYTYVVNNNDPAVQALNTGDTLTDLFTYTVQDSRGLTATAQVTITINGADDAPVLSVAATASSYTQNGPPVTLLSATTVSDVDNQTMQSATVSISSGLLTGDVLSANVAGTNITASYANGVLMLIGNDTLANYKQVLDSVTYSSTNADPTNSGTNTSRTISWVVNDGTLDSTTQTTTLNITTSTLTIPAGSTTTLNGGTLQASSIDVEGTVTGFGTIIANVIANNGTIQSKSNHTLTVEISGSIQGTGLLEITNSTTLALDGPVGSGQTVQFDIGGGPAPVLILSDPTHFQGQIKSFQGSDQIDLATSGTISSAYVDNAGLNTGGTLKIFETVNGITTEIDLKFVTGEFVLGQNLIVGSDGHGGTLITDPPTSPTTPDATATPLLDTTILTTAGAAASQTDLPSSTVDPGTMIALDAAVSELNADGAPSVTIDGSSAAADLSSHVSASGAFMVNSGAALAFTSYTISGTLTDNGTVEITSGKLEVAGAASGTGVFKIDAGATLQLDDSNAINVTFAGSSGTLILDHSLTHSFSAVISGLAGNDIIDLKDLAFTSGHMTATTSFANGNTTLEVSDNATNRSVTLTLAGDYTHSTWDFGRDPSGTGTIFHASPAADAASLSASTSSELAMSVSTGLTTHDGAADQFAFQGTGQSGTLTNSTLVPSAEPSPTEAATADATVHSGTVIASNPAISTQPAAADSTQGNTTTQAISASPAAIITSAGDTFVFAANFGHETITNFHPDTDVIEIDHTVFADVQALLAAAHDDGHGNAVITADPHDSITLKKRHCRAACSSPRRFSLHLIGSKPPFQGRLPSSCNCQ